MTPKLMFSWCSTGNISFIKLSFLQSVVHLQRFGEILVQEFLRKIILSEEFFIKSALKASQEENSFTKEALTV